MTGWVLAWALPTWKLRIMQAEAPTMLLALKPDWQRRHNSRRGAILVVVLALLALFAVIGITFVYYASTEAEIARVFKNGQSDTGPTVSTNATIDNQGGSAVDAFLSSWIYDINDNHNLLSPTGTDLLNVLRGHSLAATMFGRINRPATTTTGVVPNTSMFSGVGTFHENSNLFPFSLPTSFTDRGQLINYTSIFHGITQDSNNNPILPDAILDPEWTGGIRAGGPLSPMPNLNPGFNLNGLTYVPKNPPYTYPDLNNFFLASISPATGQVLVPSFHRTWLFNANNPNVLQRLASWDPTDNNPRTMTSRNTDWITLIGRAKILRPRPIDQLTQGDLSSAGLPFPLPPDPSTAFNAAQLDALFNLISTLINNGTIIGYPAPNIDGSFTGDVQNLSGGVGTIRNDSLLLDLGLPTFQYTSTTKGKVTLKPMASVLIRDLESAVNLSVAGNLTGPVSGPNPNGTHASYSGFGPWEINPNQILSDAVTDATAEANALVAARYGTNFTSTGRLFSLEGKNSLPFDASGIRIGASSLVNWNAGGRIPASVPQALALMTPDFAYANPFQVGPVGLTGFGGAAPTGNFSYDGMNDATVDKATNHPGLFNPGDNAFGLANKPIPANSFAYPFSDLRRLISRYSDTVENYSQTTFDRILPRQTQLLGPIATVRSAGYRTSLSHPKRLLFTTYSQTPDLPGIVANYDRIGRGMSLQLPPLGTPGVAGPHAFKPTGFPHFPLAFPNPPIPPNPPGTPTRTASGPIGPTGTNLSEFAGPNNTQNLRGAIGGIDLNRPLADYRDLVNKPNDLNGSPNPNFTANSLTPAPLGPNNMANIAQAWADRQNLARDIFGRLIVATGAAAFVDPTTGNINVPQPPTTPGGAYILTTPGGTIIHVTQTEFNALRYLAQIAVNIVDYIDKDDISTPFIWNPTGGPAGGLENIPANQIVSFAQNNMGTGQIQNCVVFGVERPRLVINESYAEITNDPNDVQVPTNQPATSPAQVRFWVELLNPTGLSYLSGTDGMLGNGSAPLTFTFTPPPVTMLPPVTYNPYSVVITQSNPAGASEYLKDPSNVTGDVGTAPNVVFNFNGGAPPPPNVPSSVPVNNGQYSTGQTLPNAGQTPGFVVLGPQISKANAIEFNPTGKAFQATPPSTTNYYIQSSPITQQTQSSAMGYQIPPITPPGGGQPLSPPSANMLDSYSVPGIEQHVVVLRRLANPYLPPNDPDSPNPALPPNSPPNVYISVDYMDNVRAFDAVHRGGGQKDTSDRMPKTSATPGDAGNKGYDPIMPSATAMLRSSLGRVQPYAGFSDVSQTFNPSANPPAPPTPATFPQSFAIPQSPSLNSWQYDQPLNTFFRHNGMNSGDGAAEPAPTAATIVQSPTSGVSAAPVTLGSETLMAPFDWLVHLDRPLINQSELLSVQAVKPHEVTQYTLQPPYFFRASKGSAPNGIPVFKDVGVVPWLGVGQQNAVINVPQNPTSAILPPPPISVSVGGLPAAFDTTMNGNFVVGTGRPTFNFTPPHSVAGPSPTYNISGNGLFRALEVLRVKPWGYGLPVGGRVPGKININTVQDPRVLQALLDPQAANGFNSTIVDNLWTTYITGSASAWSNLAKNFQTGPNATVLPFSRTPNSISLPLADGTFGPRGSQWTTTIPFPGKTIDDDPFDPNWLTLDRPFKGFGVGEFAAPRPPTPPTGFPSAPGPLDGIIAGGGSGIAQTLDYGSGQAPIPFGPGIQDTILRMGVPTNAPIGYPNPIGLPVTPGLGIGSPLINVPYPVPQQNQPPTPQATTYSQSEMLRKLLNNSTTVSNTFAVNMTIVFVQVRTNGGTVMTDVGAIPRPLLGPECFDVLPGDLRRLFFAVVDRSNMAINPGSASPSRLPQTNYLRGDKVTNGGNCYVAVNAGTTGPGPGPTGTGSGPITDGTVRWRFFGPAGPQLNPFYSALAQPPVPVLNSNNGNVIAFNLFLANTLITSGSNTLTLTVMRDGTPVQISAGMTLALGTGASQEFVIVNQVNPNGSLNVFPLNGTAVPSLQLSSPHYTGECVSNAVPGYMGPHPKDAFGKQFDAFTNSSSQFRSVVPYVVKIQ